MIRLKLHWQILLAVGLAVGAGLATAPGATLLGVEVLAIYDFLGTLFLNALKMLIVPLVVSSIIVGVAGKGGVAGLGRLGGKTLAYYLATSLLAILIGLALANLVRPGEVDGQPARDLLGLSADTGAVLEKVSERGGGDLVEIFLRMVPTNVVAAAAEGQMLGLITFSLLFGYFVTRLDGDLAGTMTRFWRGMAEVMLGITELVMRFAPLGVFALVAKMVGTSGLEAFRPLAGFFLTVLAGLALHMFVVLPMIIMLVARVSPYRHFRAMAPALLTAFSTLYECVAVLFIAQAYGLDLTVAQQVAIVLLALLTSIGVAGIPAASLVAIVLILAYVGLPAEAIGLILAVDRVLDMCRTSVNVFSDACGAVVIGRSEGESGILREER